MHASRQCRSKTCLIHADGKSRSLPKRWRVLATAESQPGGIDGDAEHRQPLARAELPDADPTAHMIGGEGGRELGATLTRPPDPRAPQHALSGIQLEAGLLAQGGLQPPQVRQNGAHFPHQVTVI